MMYQPIRTWHILRCLDCGHVWDDLDPNHEICACFDKTGSRRSELLTAVPPSRSPRPPQHRPSMKGPSMKARIATTGGGQLTITVPDGITSRPDDFTQLLRNIHNGEWLELTDGTYLNPAHIITITVITEADE